MLNPKLKANLSSIRSFKFTKNECGFEEFTTPDNSEPLDVYRAKSNMHKCHHVFIPMEKLAPAQFRMSYNLLEKLENPFSVFLRTRRQVVWHFSRWREVFQIQGPIQNQRDFLPDAPVWRSQHASLLKNISWISVLKSVFSCLIWVKTWTGFSKTAWLCQTSSCFTASSWWLSLWENKQILFYTGFKLPRNRKF